MGDLPGGVREARVLSAVGDTPVRAPKVLAICDDESILGVPFYVMEFMHGTVITHTIPPAIDNSEGRAQIADELIARYEERTGRSMSDLRWYQALALWKAAVFMEGNYKRSLAGTTDDPYLALFDKGVPQLAEAAHEITKLPAPST